MVIFSILFNFVRSFYFSNDVIPVKIIKYNQNYFLFGIVNNNSFVMKLNPFKTNVWNRVIHNVSISDAFIRNDTIFILSYFPFFSIVKITTNGDFLSSITYDTYDNTNYNVFSDIFGNIYISTFSHIMKLDRKLKLQWIKEYSLIDICNGTGDFFLLCRYNFSHLAILKINLDGEVLKAKSYGLYSTTNPIKIIRRNDKLYIFSQYVDISTRYYIFISAIDTSLNSVFWSKVYKPRDNVDLYVSDVKEVGSNFIVLGSHFNDIFYFSIDTLGNLIFSKKSNNPSLEKHPKISENTIYYYNHDSLSVFDINIVDGSSCLNDMDFIIDVYNVVPRPLLGISINYTNKAWEMVNYQISGNSFLTSENTYCKVSIDETINKPIFNSITYNIAGRNCTYKSSGIYILKTGRGYKKVIKRR
ncbi:MAG: hypothetical protein N2504_06955 [candidate division WOR-3 bacterium]|nr:hypothetical protein [candidate division WOR-3 bacterium]MCX7948305.1 hypothetical protein [candidate division WOR-3 bacterium]MDW8151149.1 hypothetical protein [candidate division WOR-3 bacterium]